MRQGTAPALFQVAMLLVSSALLTGCVGNPFNRQAYNQSVRSQPAMANGGPYRDMQSRAAGLDAQNEGLQAQLAQQQQQTLQAQNALRQSQQRIAQLEQERATGTNVARSRGTPASTASYGANDLPLAKISGAEVVRDGEVIRIRIETSQLFGAGKSELKSNVNRTLDDIAQALRNEYSGRMAGVEGHTDADPITKSKWHSNHELAVSRSVSVFQALKKRGVAESQLFVSGYGPNRPVAENSNNKGKAQNRRVEVVIYPQPPGQ